MAPRIAVTSGEPAGIGPELVVRLAHSGLAARWVYVGDPALLDASARSLGIPLALLDDDGGEECLAPGTLSVRALDLDAPARPGVLDRRNARYVIRTLETAGKLCLSGECAGMLTPPVHKGVINDAGIAFSGHTEFLAAQAGVARVVMMLLAGTLRVALATTHLPLRAVPDAIQQGPLEEVLRILDASLRGRFRIDAPRILVLGLNPHAGEGGHLGREEIDVIEPVLRRLRAEGMNLEGPLPADTAFVPRHLAHADAVLAMYHDQGLPVLKHAGFGNAVNLTLGLPYIRTSVDHGTALDLAGSGQADPGSVYAAANLALALCQTADPKAA